MPSELALRSVVTRLYWRAYWRTERGMTKKKPRLAGLLWSGRRGSNSRPSAWEADALPTELRPRDPHLSPALLSRPGVAKPPRRLEQMLGQHLHIGEHGHEVRVARPARDDVLVHVVEDAGARGPAEVPAEVEALRR